MEAAYGKPGLDINFRRNVLDNVIIKTLKELSENSQNPTTLRKIDVISTQFERKLFEKAKSKDDYVTKLHQRLTKAKPKLLDVLAPHSIGDQVQQRHVVTQQHPLVLNKFQQDWELGQQNLHQVSHVHTPQMQHPLVNSQEQRNQVQESTSLSSIPQLQMAAANAFSSSPNHESIGTTDWPVLITKFRHMRSRYLPEVIKMQKNAENKCAHAQNMVQFQKMQHTMDVLGNMAKFLQMREYQMMGLSKEKLIHYMNTIIRLVNPNHRSNARNQAHAGANQLQTTLLNSTQISEPMNMIPPLYVDPGFPPSQSSATNSPLYGSRNATQHMTSQNLLHQGPRGTVDQNTKNDASFHPNSSGATSQLGTTFISVDSPMTSVTPSPSSVPKEILPGKPILSVSSATKDGDSQTHGAGETTQIETEHQDHFNVLGTHRISAVPLQSKKLADSAKQPIQHLIEMVQSMSCEALTSSIDDIVSAISTMDRLPDYAYVDMFELTTEMDLISSLSYSPQALDRDSDRLTQDKKLKRDISSISRDASMTSDSDDSISKRPRIESKYELAVEIRKTNQRLVETVIEVASTKSVEETEASNGTVVRCTYKPVAFSDKLKRHLTSAPTLEALSVEFIVPLDYPITPPQILDRLPQGCIEETIDLLAKAQFRFNRRVQGLQQPMSLADMARAWDDSARSVVLDFALCVGGETFNCKYGTWGCVSAPS